MVSSSSRVSSSQVETLYERFGLPDPLQTQKVQELGKHTATLNLYKSNI